MKEYNATVYKVDGTFYEMKIPRNNSLKTLQNLVDGLIEVVQLADRKETRGDLVINEEGILLDLPVNPFSEKVTRGTIWRETIFYGDIVWIEGGLM